MSKKFVPLSSIVIEKGLQTGPFGSQLKANEYTSEGIPIVMPKDIEAGRVSTKSIARTSVQKAQQLKKHFIKPGDILFPRRGDLGRIAVASTDNEGWICGTGCLRARIKENISFSYIHQFLMLPQVLKWLETNALGQTMLNLNTEIISELPIYLPSLAEQKQIAFTLEQWDTAIEKTEALIDAKERQFGWLQKSVLDDDFKSYGGHLSDYARIMKQQKIEEVGDLKPLTVKLHCKGIEANERDVQITLSKKGRPYFQRFSGEFLIGRQNFHNGGFGIVPERLDGFIASSAITTLEIDPAKLDPKYLFYFFSRKDYYLRIGHIMDGTGQKELSDKQIMNLPVSIPSIEKQKEVVALLDTAQQEINLLKKLADQYRRQKRGLMQKLLSGQWHIKNKEAA